jgi:hypothetical protein
VPPHADVDETEIRASSSAKAARAGTPFDGEAMGFAPRTSSFNSWCSDPRVHDLEVAQAFYLGSCFQLQVNGLQPEYRLDSPVCRKAAHCK